MNADIYAQWLRRQGHEIVRTNSSYWDSEGFGVYQAFPYHWTIDPSDEELATLFSRRRALALRYSMAPTSIKGCPSHCISYEGERYEMDGLGYRTRKNVRRGLRNCSVERIGFHRLVKDGWGIRIDALERQARRLSITREAWGRRYLSADEYPGFHAWGAMVDDRLAAYMVTFRMEDCIYIIDQQSHRDYLDLNVNNAMTFVVSKDGVAQPGVRVLFYGLESLDAPQRVTDFKVHMGYTVKAIRQRVVSHPYLNPFLRSTHALAKLLVTLSPRSRRLTKAEGLLRICLTERKLRPAMTPLPRIGP